MKDEKMTEQTLLKYKPSLAKLIDAWRRTQNDFPSRADAFRRLTGAALHAAGFRLPDEETAEEPKTRKPTKKGGKA
jgi:hypothetical protein